MWRKVARRHGTAVNGSLLQTCAHHMLMMIAAMRDNLWLMTGRLDLMPAQVQVLPLVNDAIENLQGLLRERVRVVVEVPADSLCCMDLDRLKHVIHIPLANAVKYTKRGTVKVCSRLLILTSSFYLQPEFASVECCVVAAMLQARCSLTSVFHSITSYSQEMPNALNGSHGIRSTSMSVLTADGCRSPVD